MKVYELKALLAEADDDLEVVAIGHFGEGIKVSNSSGWGIGHNVGVVDCYWEWRAMDKNVHKKVFCISAPNMGEEPE